MYLKPETCLHNKCYKIICHIGQGGFGITYLAEETGYLKSTGFGEQYVANKNPGKVVVKELYFDDFCSRDSDTGLVYITNTNKKVEFEKLVNKQLEEGRILKNLSHQNIVNTLDIFRENDTAYMVLEYIDGINIEEMVQKEGKFSLEKASGYIKEILTAVSYIHEKKVLHLDVTPGNILIQKSDDRAILIDFGTSQTYGNDNHIEAATSKLVVGIKKHYAPFEQSDIDNLKEFDATFDTYAIGATFYFMLTGTPPPIASLVLSGMKEIEPPSSENSSVNPATDALILKALSPQYPNRFKSAAELADSLDQAITNIQKNTILIPEPKRKIGPDVKINESQAKRLFEGKKDIEIIQADPKNEGILTVVVPDTPKSTVQPINTFDKISPPPKKSSNTIFYVLGAAIVLLIICLVIFKLWPSQTQNQTMDSVDSTVTPSIDSSMEVITPMTDTSSVMDSTITPLSGDSSKM